MRFRVLLVVAGLLCLTGGRVFAQAPPAEKPSEKPKTLLEEMAFFGYLENSAVFNLNGAGHGGVNELRLYDLDEGYTFNMGEFSVKKDPSDARPWGFGLVLTAGRDPQKNHALGLLRDEDDTFPFRHAAAFDVQEGYASYKIPVGSGLTIKAGKFVTLLGYEVIESPNNLNFSRSFLFGFAIPFTHVGALASYSLTDWLTVTAGPVMGWDVARDNNDAVSATGQFALTPIKDVTAALNWITGPEQADNDTHNRTVLDWTTTYTGIKKVTLGLNVDRGWESQEASLVASGTRNDTGASWWGVAGYVAYDWTEKLRTALRAEYFADPESVRTAAQAAGRRTALWETTATVQYRIWRGLVARVEYRHDQANEKVFKLDRDQTPTAKNQDTVALDLYYLFF